MAFTSVAKLDSLSAMAIRRVGSAPTTWLARTIVSARWRRTRIGPKVSTSLGSPVLAMVDSAGRGVGIGRGVGAVTACGVFVISSTAAFAAARSSSTAASVSEGRGGGVRKSRRVDLTVLRGGFADPIEREDKPQADDDSSQKAGRQKRPSPPGIEPASVAGAGATGRDGDFAAPRMGPGKSCTLLGVPMIDEGGDGVEPALEGTARLRSLLKGRRSRSSRSPVDRVSSIDARLLGDRLGVSHEMDGPEPVA